MNHSRQLALLLCVFTGTSGLLSVFADQKEPAKAEQKDSAKDEDKKKRAEQKRREEETKLNEQWALLPFEEKRWLLRYHQAMVEMPKEEKRFITDRFERFLRMKPEERDILKQNYARWSKMTPEQQQWARNEYLKRRKEFEEEWKTKNPDKEPPPFKFRLPRELPAEATTNPAPAAVTISTNPPSSK